MKEQDANLIWRQVSVIIQHQPTTLMLYLDLVVVVQLEQVAHLLDVHVAQGLTFFVEHGRALVYRALRLDGRCVNLQLDPLRLA